MSHRTGGYITTSIHGQVSSKMVFEVFYSVARVLRCIFCLALRHLGHKVYSHHAKSAMKYQISMTLNPLKEVQPAIQNINPHVQFSSVLICYALIMRSRSCICKPLVVKHCHDIAQDKLFAKCSSCRRDKHRS